VWHNVTAKVVAFLLGISSFLWRVAWLPAGFDFAPTTAHQAQHMIGIIRYGVDFCHHLFGWVDAGVIADGGIFQ